MNILNSLTLRSLKLNRKRTIVTVIGIILSAAMICGVATLVASFQDLFIQSAKETDGDYHATFFDVSPDRLKYIADNPYTKTAMLSRDLGFALFKDSPYENKPYFYVKEYDTTAFAHLPVQLTEGRFPEKVGEVVVSEEIVSSSGDAYQIGDTITLEIGDRFDQDVALGNEVYNEGETLEPRLTKTYTITGLIKRPHFESYSGVPGFTMIAYLDESRLAPGEAVNISILGSRPRQIFEQVPEMAENAGVSDYDYNDELLRYMGIAGGDLAKTMINTLAAIVILLIVVGSVTVIYNAFAIAVSERKKQFGMLAGVGATPAQIRKTVFYEGALLGLVGLPAGILSGIGGIGVTLSVVARLLRDSVFSGNIALRLVVSPAVILTTVLFVGLIIFLSAYVPAQRAASVAPIDAIRQSTDLNIRGKNVKTAGITRLLFGIEGELALKNLKRNRKRYRATVVSLFISIVLFISFSSFITYGFRSSDIYYQDIPYDVTVLMHDSETTIKEKREVFNRIAALEDVERSAMIRSVYSRAFLEESQLGAYLMENHVAQGRFEVDESGRYGIGLIVYTLDERAFEQYAAENGLDPADYRDPDNFKGILVNKNIAWGGRIVEYEPLNLKAGEDLPLQEDAYGDDNTANYTVTVGAVTDNLPFGITSGSDAVSLVVSEAVFEEILLLLPENSRDQSRQAQLYFSAGDSEALVEAINNLDAVKAAHQGLYIQNVTANRQSAQRTTTAISIFLYGFVILITLIGVTNIFNTISTNVALRRREFAMLKSVGLTPKGFNRMINYESIFYGLKALLYGLPVSVLISIWMYNAFGNKFGFAFVLPWKEILVCIAAVFVIVFITMIHAGAKLKNDNIIDALKEENL